MNEEKNKNLIRLNSSGRAKTQQTERKFALKTLTKQQSVNVFNFLNVYTCQFMSFPSGYNTPTSLSWLAKLVHQVVIWLKRMDIEYRQSDRVGGLCILKSPHLATQNAGVTG